jgi:hypothetical protein
VLVFLQKKQLKFRVLNKGISMSDIKEVLFELAQAQKETDRKIKELGKQIGGLGDRFGSFTEGMAISSMERILRREFKADHVAARSKVYDKTGKVLAEYDILAWCNSDVNRAANRTVVVVEVKSTLRPDHVKEFEQTLTEFRSLNAELADKNLYGILAFVGNTDKKLQEHCQNKGIYTVTIHDEVFKLNTKTSGTFKPKSMFKNFLWYSS